MEFRILGTLEACAEGAPLRLGGAKQRALLALLLLNLNDVVSSDRLIDELWGERPPATALKALQVHVSQLRKLLESSSGGEARPRALETSPAGYVLRLDPERLDSTRFEGMLAEAEGLAARGDPSAAETTLSRALELWRGPALADFRYERFAQAEIARLEELRLTAVELRAEAQLALGRHAEIVGELQALVAREPLRERPRAQLMRALYGSGRQAEALEAYRLAQEALVEIGLEPGAELRELQRAVLNQDPSLQPARPSRAPAIPAGDASDGDFVGRERELRQIAGRLEGALAGHGGLVLVGGEPGIGKSRLLARVAAHAGNRGARVLWGRAWEAGGAPAYWLWVQALRTYVSDADAGALRAQLGTGAAEIAQILPELLDVLPGIGAPVSVESGGARVRLFDAMSGLLRRAAESQPLLLLLDDLHAADTPSLLMLEFLARQLPDARVLVVGAYRDAAGGPGAALEAALVELPREPGVEQLSLGGLERSDVGRYIDLAAGVQPPPETVARIHDDTAGNPLFVGELVRLFAAEGRLEHVGDGDGPRIAIPEGVRHVIGRRLNRLSDECRRVLALASVFGRDFDPQALQPVARLPVEGLAGVLDEAFEARVIGRAPASARRLQFSHALVRDTLYDELAPARRALLHRAAGEALELLYGEDAGPHLAELAHHFAEAASRGDAAKSAAYARRAGDRAASQLAFEEAVRLYRLALRSLDLREADDPATRCELLLSCAEVQMRAGDEPGGKSTFREAATLARAAHMPEQLARAALGYAGRFLWVRASSDPALVPFYEDALAELDEGDSELRAKLLARLACALRDEPSRARRTALADEAVAVARRLGDNLTLNYVLDAAREATASADTLDAQAATLPGMLTLAAATGDLERAFAAHEYGVVVALQFGDPESVSVHLEAMAPLADELRQPAQHWLLAVWRAAVALMRGELASAEELIERARGFGSEAQSWNAAVSYRAATFILRREQGRLPEVEETLARSVEEYPALVRFPLMLAYLYAESGRAAQAREIYEPLVTAQLDEWHTDAEWLFSMVVLADTVALLGDGERAAILYPILLPYERYNALAHAEACIGAAGRALGSLAATTGRWAEAWEHFERAIEMNDKMGARPWVAHTKREYARMLLRRGATGDAAHARLLLDDACSTYDALGFESWAARASALRDELEVARA